MPWTLQVDTMFLHIEPQVTVLMEEGSQSGVREGELMDTLDTQDDASIHRELAEGLSPSSNPVPSRQGEIIELATKFNVKLVCRPSYIYVCKHCFNIILIIRI